MRARLSILLGLLLLLLGGIALAQVSGQFDLRWWAVSAGGSRESAQHRLVDSLGQPVVGIAQSTNARVESGFPAGAGGATATPTPTATATSTYTPSPTVTPTSTPTGTPPPPGDAYEPDDNCAQAATIGTDGSTQSHNFHIEGDVDWVKFNAQANKTYKIEVNNVGTQADVVIFLHENCSAPPGGSGEHAFGETVTLEWDAIHSGAYYIKLQQFDPSFFGADTDYTISVTVDTTPPSPPTNVRCVTVNTTTLGVQWRRSPERDVRRYRVNYRNQAGTFSGSDDVLGRDTTYYELTGLTPGEAYLMRVLALDFSGNESLPSGQVTCLAVEPTDTTRPSITIQQPTSTGLYTTTAGLMTFAGQVQDAGNNLSRVRVRNATLGVEGWDFTLSGGSDDFRVTDLALNTGDNTIQVTAFDDAGNTATETLTVRRVGQSPGAVIIVAGHNETFGLATNIYNAASRAYRIFASAGYNPDDIYFLAPVPLDADGNGTPDTDATATVTGIQQAITVWAAGKVGPGKPLFMYWMDHGFSDKFCVEGCGSGQVVTPSMLDGWLRTLETASGVDQVNVVIEACRSGSFIHRAAVVDSISRPGRVVITSTGWDNNAYASAQGAYFSDAFFSCLAASDHLKACFDQANAAVQVTGVQQTPMLDDNGDGVFNSSDGTIAQGRYVTRFFASSRPRIVSVDVQQTGNNGILTAVVEEGAEPIELVWAAVYPPDFHEPDFVTLNLNVPVVRLEPVAGQPGHYRFDYINGFTQGPAESYRIIFYAQDRLGIAATPRRYAAGVPTFLPLLLR
ncbi:MAG: hypothetical protein D6791_07835 [Chloroflexi bacterium]|nr:MAG: hypothetical protein D6791_07835 [Chloroflexota bacterium]